MDKKYIGTVYYNLSDAFSGNNFMPDICKTIMFSDGHPPAVIEEICDISINKEEFLVKHNETD